MLSAAGIGEKIMWGVLVLLMLGYMGGTWINRKRSKAFGTWLQGGLRIIGGRPTWKWVGTMSSGAQVLVTDAAAPFRQVEIIYLLLTREFLPLWAIERVRGKRDTLVVRAELRVAPAREFEVVPMHGSLYRALNQGAEVQPWTWQQMPAGLGLATRSTGDEALAARIRALLERYGPYIQRFSLRKRQPNLILFIRLTGPERAPAEQLLRAIREAVA